MKILIISNYLSPEIGAASNRMNSLVKELDSDNDISVDIITNIPNYPKNEVYKEYGNKFYVSENMYLSTTLHRIYVPFLFRRNKLISRLLQQMLFAFMSFFVAMNLIKKNKYGLVFVSSPPLFIGYTAFLVSKIIKVPWVLEIRDLWGESIRALTKAKGNSMLMNWIFFLERFLYRRATKIIAVTNGIKNNILKINSVNPENVSVITNGIPTWINNTKSKSDTIKPDDKIIVGYIGTLGLAQEFKTLLTVAHNLKDKKSIEFMIVGDGQRWTEIEEFIKEKELTNVTLLPSIYNKDELIKLYKKIDIGFIPLVKNELFHGAIPSKLFELAYLKIPIIYSGTGEGADIIKTYKLGEVVTPERIEELEKAIMHLINVQGHVNFDSVLLKEFEMKYNWENIARKYKEEFMKII